MFVPLHLAKVEERPGPSKRVIVNKLLMLHDRRVKVREIVKAIAISTVHEHHILR